MSVALPTPDQLRAIAEYCGLALTDEDVTSFRGLMQGSVDAYNAVAAMPDEVPVVKYPRTPGYRPAPEDNPRNAWYRKSTVKGAASGKLKGKTVALEQFSVSHFVLYTALARHGLSPRDVTVVNLSAGDAAAVCAGMPDRSRCRPRR